MKKEAFIIAIFVVFCSGALRAQLTINYMDLGINDMVGKANTSKVGMGLYNNISGTPYLDEDFVESEVFYNREYKISNVPVRYNLYSDQIEYKSKNATLQFGKPTQIDSIVSKDGAFMYIAKSDRHKVNGIVKLWNKQYPALITKMKVEFHEQEEPQAFAETKPDRFERTMDRHYLMKGKDEIVPIKSVKKLIGSLGAHSSELSSFAKKNKISSGDPEELAKLLDYFHGL